jgi:hypothetical protein
MNNISISALLTPKSLEFFPSMLCSGIFDISISLEVGFF